MPSFSRRSNRSELLDGMDIPFADIRQNMAELNVINKWLGGHAITLKGIRKLIRQQPATSNEIIICEIGCGGGDNLRAIDNFIGKKGHKISYIGIDINPHCIAYAEKHTPLSHVTWITSDYRDAQFRRAPDIIFSSLFCHHFTDDQLSEMFQWMSANSRLGFFINDLHRHPLAYHSIKMLTFLFSRSYMVRNDAPLSVLRGFKKNEIIHLMQRAGIPEYSIEWKWAFRWLVTVPGDQRLQDST